jgi:hypothetical protein
MVESRAAGLARLLEELATEILTLRQPMKKLVTAK